MMKKKQMTANGDKGGEEDKDESDFYEVAEEQQVVSADEQSGRRTIAGVGVGGDTEERLSSIQLLRRAKETASMQRGSELSQISRVQSKRR